MIVVAASPSQYRFAPGALSFYDAATLDYMGCAATGVKPEGKERGFSDMLTRMTCSSVLTALLCQERVGHDSTWPAQGLFGPCSALAASTITCAAMSCSAIAKRLSRNLSTSV